MSQPSNNGNDRVLKPLQENWPILAKYLSETDMLNLNLVVPFAPKWQIFWHFSQKDFTSEVLLDLMKDPTFDLDPLAHEGVTELLSRALLYPHHHEHEKEAIVARIKSHLDPSYRDPEMIAQRKRELESRCRQEGLEGLMAISNQCHDYIEGYSCVASLEECIAELILENELLRHGENVYDMRFRAYRDILNDLVFEGSRLEDGDYNIFRKGTLMVEDFEFADNNQWDFLNGEFFMLSVNPYNQPTRERWVLAAILLVSSRSFNEDCNYLADLTDFAGDSYVSYDDSFTNRSFPGVSSTRTSFQSQY